MKELESGYTYESDNINSGLWNELVLQFDDASFYQTWSYGAIHSGEKSLSHLVLKRNKRLVGMAQARIVRIPGLPIGMAYINWGPMWKVKNERNEISHFRNILRALYKEYVVHRKCFLRISPGIIDSKENTVIKDVFAEEGFSCSENPVKTVVLDLSIPLDELRQNLSRKWRQTLQVGEKKGLEIIEGKKEELCQISQKIFDEMKKRKKFYGGDQTEAIEVHKKLPEKLKLHFIATAYNNEPVAALGFVAFGSTGLPLISATSGKALKLNAAYVLWWKMIEYYKKNGFLTLDMGGVSEERNPGGYYFKTHIPGKNFNEPDRYLGQFDACENFLTKFFVDVIFTLRDRYHGIRRKMAKQKER